MSAEAKPILAAGDSAAPIRREPKGPVWLAAGSLILAGVVPYLNSFSVPFLFDDETAIFYNLSIRHLWPVWGMLVPPSTGAPVTGRPIANVSFALNYALGGFRVEGYHAFNLAVHLLAGLLLFGVVRRTLLQPVLRESFGAAALPLAWLSTLLWLVHPLLSEPVTYVVGRTEVLMGFLYLSTLYAAMRAMGSSLPVGWQVAAVGACFAGMATKEVMVTAPLMTLLYDRTFVAGTFRAAWKRRKGFYLSLAASWALLAFLMMGEGGASRGGSAGFNRSMAWWEYLATQFYAIARYLRLSVFPHSLVFDYGTYLAKNPFIVIPCGLLIAGLGTATAIALWRKPVWGFLGAWFFGILAPSSSVVPVITQTIAERRMYLALPVVMVGVALGLRRGLNQGYLPVGLVIAVTWAAMTAVRNHDFRSARSIWEDTVARWPGEPRAHLNLGFALMSNPASAEQAVFQFEQVLRLRPDFEMAYGCLGSALSMIPGRATEAESAFEKELQLRPQSALGHLDYGLFLKQLPGRQQAAAVQIRTALRLEPDDVAVQAQARAALGSMLVKLAGRRSEGIDELRQAIVLFPDLAQAHAGLGLALADDPADTAEGLLELEKAQRLNPDSAEIRIDVGTILARIPGRQSDAISAYRAAVVLDDNSWQAHYNMGKLLLGIPGSGADAIENLEAAARLAPDFADAHTSLGIVLSGIPGRADEAVRQFEAAVRASPNAEDARINLGAALSQVPGRQQEAVEQYQAALRLNPKDADAYYRIGCILANVAGRTDEAIRQFENALRLNPDLVEAHFDIAALSQNSPASIPRAIEHLKAVLKLAPNDVTAKQLLAKLTSNP